MRRILLFAVAALFFVGCQTNQKSEATSDTAESGVVINYETESGIPEFSEVADQAMKLRYKFTAGVKAHLVMDYTMTMEMMGQKIPMHMIMESDYEVKSLTDNGDAKIGVTFTRISMEMDGPQVVKFDSDEVEDLKADPMGAMFAPMLSKPISSVISPEGKVLEMDIDALLEGLPEEEATQVRTQVESMSDQFAQNAFVVLPSEPVKIGDTYEAGVIETDAGGMKINMNMKYKVLSISNGGRYVTLEPNGAFSFNSDMPGVEMNTDNNKIGGWMLFDLEKGLPLRSNMLMSMNITANQMGQEMQMKIDMDVKMKVE